MKATQVFILLFVGTAIGCAIWLGFFHDWHDFDHQLTTESRHAEAVGAKPLPVEPVKIEIVNRSGDCFVVDSAEFDGDAIYVLYHAVCSETFEMLHWQQYSPNDILLDAGGTWLIAGDRVERGTKGEGRSNALFKLDPRTIKVKVGISRD